MFDQLLEDFTEPGVLKLALDLDITTLNMLSQGTMTQTKTSKQDLLHCVASGFGEKVSLVSPFQRYAMEAGHPYHLFNEQTSQDEEVSIPNNFSFKDISLIKTEQNNINFLKVMDVQLKPGDCVYIPAYWWYQIQTMTPKKPGQHSSEAQLKAHDEQMKELSISVDFWYHVHSYWLENMFHGIEN